MGIIQIQNLSFRYPGAATPIFKQLSLNLDDRWHLGVIGRNGRGKTTLLNLLRGRLTGTGQIQAQVSFNYFPRTIGSGERTVADLFSTMDVPTWRAEIELTRIGLPSTMLERSWATLSGGERTKVLLAAGFTDDRALPLIDEPTNHLDLAGREVVGRYLQRQRGFICVSHDQHFLDSFVDHVLLVTRQGVELFAGNVTTALREKARQDQQALTQNAVLRQQIGQLQQRAATQRNWASQRENATNDATSRAKAKKMMRRAKTFEARTAAHVAQRQGLLADVDQTTNLKTAVQSGNGNRLWVSLRHFTVCRADRPLFAPVDLDFHQGDRLAVLGPNGAGKSSLLTELQRPGTLDIRGYCSGKLPSDIGLVVQDFSAALRRVSPSDWAALPDRTLVWNLMHQLGVNRERLRAPAADWSMGEAKKAALALSLCQPHALLIWDEPTNYLDLAARQQLQILIQQVQPTMIIVDHDRDFVAQTCTQQVLLQPEADNH